MTGQEMLLSGFNVIALTKDTLFTREKKKKEEEDARLHQKVFLLVSAIHAKKVKRI